MSSPLRKLLVLHLLTAIVHAVPDTTLCGQYENVTDQSNTYSFSTNVWGRDNSGSSCVEIVDNATTLSTTWSWTANDTLVHAFPNINYNPIQRNPVRMANLSSLDVKVSWSMKPTLDSSSAALDATGLSIINAKSNVAFDAFFDTQLEKAVNTTAPSYEVMVWIGTYGSILPIGAENAGDPKKLPKQKIGKETFTLYQGPNGNGQHVFTWIAGSNHTTFEGDISPLIHYLWRHGMVLSGNYIGVIQLGTEQKHATSNVTFSASNFAISVTRGTPKGAGNLGKSAPPMTVVVAVALVALLRFI